MEKNLPANAGDTGSIPGPGRIHMHRSNEDWVPQLLSPHFRAWARQQEQPQQWEARAPQLESDPHSPQLEKALAQQRRSSATRSK